MLLSVLGLAVAPPIIDVHRHAAWAYSDKSAVRDDQVAAIERAGIEIAVVAVTDYDEPERWQHDNIIVGVKPFCPRNLAEPRYNCFPSTEGWADIKWLEREVSEGRVRAIHELAPNYSGISPDNPRLHPYWELAIRYDIPVGVHTQRGPAPGGRFSSRADPNCCPDYDPAMGNPDLLRPVLERHPGLRVWIQHVGAGRGDHMPFWEETMALLADYPNVYVDLSITNAAMPDAQYEAALAKLIKAGFEDRIMYGSDMLPVETTIERLNAIEWLSDAQRRAILHDNAARFFRIED